MTTPRNLVRDTVYWRTRSAVMRACHAFDDAVWRACRDRVRILVEATSPVSLAVCRPVLEQLVTDPRIRLSFTSSDRAWPAERTFGSAADVLDIIPPARARLMKFDAYLNTDFWNMTWLPRRTRRVHLFHGIAGKYGLDAPVGIAPVVASFDRILFPNRDRLRRYADAGLVDPDGPQAALVGYPKVDCLVDDSLDRNAIQHALALDPGRPTVLYAPTWSPDSSLDTMGREIVAALTRLPLNVVVKLHDRSIDMSPRGSSGSDWRRYFADRYPAGAVHFAEDADASPYLYASDVLITDHSSVGFEFMLLDRPVVVVDCPNLIARARINPQKVSLLRSAASVAATPDAAATAVERALADPVVGGAQRRAIAAELFHAAGTATRRAVRAIYDLVELDAPQPAAAAWTGSCSGDTHDCIRRPVEWRDRTVNAQNGKASSVQ